MIVGHDPVAPDLMSVECHQTCVDRAHVRVNCLNLFAHSAGEPGFGVIDQLAGVIFLAR